MPLAYPSFELPFLDPLTYYPLTEGPSFVDIEVKPDFKSVISQELIEFGGNTQFSDKKTLLAQFTKEKQLLLKECINGMLLTSENDYIAEAFKKILDKRRQFNELGIKSDENVQSIIELRFKPILQCSEESLNLMKTIYET